MQNLSNFPSYLDVKILAQIKDLCLRAQTVADGFYSGLHHASGVGQSLEFLEHRPYFYGDDIKTIDWKIYSRTDRFIVKQYEKESNLKIIFVIDTSASMGFKSQSSLMNKYEFSLTLAASMSYLALRQNDAVGLLLNDQESLKYLPPCYGKNSLLRLFDVPDVSQLKNIEFEQTINFLKTKIKKHIVFILSDFLGNSDAICQTIKELKLKGNSVFALQILDPKEINFSYSGILELQSLEDSSILNLDADAIKEVYKNTLNKMIQEYREFFQRYGILFFSFDTKMIPAEILRLILQFKKI